MAGAVEIRASGRDPGRWSVYVDGRYHGSRDTLGRAYRFAAVLAWDKVPDMELSLVARGDRGTGCAEAFHALL